MPSDPNHHDRVLIRGIRDRDEQALLLVIRAYGTYVYGKAVRIAREPVFAEEIAQDTFLALWQQPDRFDISKGNLRAFLIGVARNKAIDLVRHEQSVHSREPLATEFEQWTGTTPEQRVDDGLELRGALSELPRSKREAIFLAYFKGMTYREVAVNLQIPEATAKTRIRDALIKMRAILVESRVADR
ncbi:MAG: RNA polymerase sigma factor [Actinomycetota bacterium]